MSVGGTGVVEDRPIAEPAVAAYVAGGAAIDLTDPREQALQRRMSRLALRYAERLLG